MKTITVLYKAIIYNHNKNLNSELFYKFLFCLSIFLLLPFWHFPPLYLFIAVTMAGTHIII